MTTILDCKCDNAFQDKKYGLGKRLHNMMANGQYRCTVCGEKNGRSKKEEK